MARTYQRPPYAGNDRKGIFMYHYNIGVLEVQGINGNGRAVRFVFSISPVYGEPIVMLRVNGYGLHSGQHVYSHEYDVDITNQNPAPIAQAMRRAIAELHELVGDFSAVYRFDGEQLNPNDPIPCVPLLLRALDANGIEYNLEF